MKKFSIAAIILGALICVSGVTFSAGTADNWSATLQFSTNNTADLLPVKIGESTSATEMLKPPPLPGMADTSSADDAIVNAYVRSASRQTATSILTADASKPAKLWEMQVDVEEPNADVYVTPTLTDAYGLYKISIIDADTGARTVLTTGGQKVKVFTSGASGANKTLYAMAGTSQTFAIAKSDGSVIGGTAIGGCSLDACSYRSGINIYLDGSNNPTATTGTGGTFTISSLTAGSHPIKFDGDYMLASSGTLTVPTSGTSATAVLDLRAGDAVEDANNTIDFQDLKCLKKVYKTSNPVCDLGGSVTGDADFDLNGTVDFNDLKILKLNYKAKE